MSFTVGENIGPYQIVEKLGQGGMATVYKAYHANLDRYVALKALHPAFNGDTSFASRFQREARVVARLEHPNIVPVYDYAEHAGRPYLVMKFIEGDTLKARLDQGPLNSTEISRIVDAVGSALGYAHKQGVLHRDIKPSNVLLANDGQIYLADFGLARMAQSGESTLSSDMIMGTPQYISPEQAMGKADLDQRTDLYSFGVMLYEMVVGRVPFNADTPFSIIHDHIYSPLPLPHVVNPNVPQQVERVLLKSLAKERTDRYEDALVLIDAFKQAWADAGVPMRGTEARVSHAMKAVEIPPPTEKITVVNGVPAVPTRVAEKPQEAAASSGSAKKRSPWMWVSAGLLVIVCLGGLVYARNNRLFIRFFQNRQNPPVTAPTQPLPIQPTPQAQLQPTQLPPQNNQPQPLATTVGGVIMPPEVAEMVKRAGEKPEDINLQLELALAYWNAGWNKEAYETIGNIIRLSGVGNTEFFMQAGDKFKAQKDGWLPASAFYFQAVRAFQLNGKVPFQVVDAFHEALYKGADRPEASLLVPYDRVIPVDQGIALVAQGRNALFISGPVEATKLLEEARRTVPDMRETRLLEAEIMLQNQQPEQARAILEALSTDSSTPEWIRTFAKQLLDGIK